MVNCPTCGEPLPVIAAKGALKVHAGAGLVSWRGKILPLGDRERSLVKAIMINGSATWDELKAAHGSADLESPAQLPAKVSINLINVTLSHLRRKLLEAGVTCELKNIRGWGMTIVDHGKGSPPRRSANPLIPHH
jgi:DNA-binding response OmpR family regulator